VWVFCLDLAGVLSEIVNVFLQCFHVLAGVFEGLAFRFCDDLVLITGAGATSKLHRGGDTDVTSLDVLHSCGLFTGSGRFVITYQRAESSDR